MSDRKRVRLFLDDGNCICYSIARIEATEQKPQGETWAEMLDGFTERNIGELVDVLTKQGYHVTLYRVGHPEFHSPKREP